LHERLITIINQLNQSDKLLAAICFGPWMLAKAGVLENRKYTSSIVKWQEELSELFGIQDPFPVEGYVEARVVRDKNIITAKGAAFIDFAIEVCDYFGGFQEEDQRENFEREYKG
jgi:putative intracellular protease/amidase